MEKDSIDRLLERGRVLAFEECLVCKKTTLHLIILLKPHDEPIKFYSTKKCLNFSEHSNAEKVDFIFNPYNHIL